MKEIKLTKGYSTLVDDEDYELLAASKWFAMVTRPGNVYACTANKKEKGKSIRMHRLLMNAKPSEIVDHINGNRLDNRRANLRLCNHSQNMVNRKSRKNTSSKYLGVSLQYKGENHTLWCTIVGKNGRTVYQAYFKSEEEAALAYDREATKAHGEFAKLNFPKLHINSKP